MPISCPSSLITRISRARMRSLVLIKRLSMQYLRSHCANQVEIIACCAHRTRVSSCNQRPFGRRIADRKLEDAAPPRPSIRQRLYIAPSSADGPYSAGTATSFNRR